MSQIQRSFLRLVDAKKVELIAIHRNVIRLLTTDEGLMRFPFDSDEAARAAYNDWIQEHPSVERQE